MCMTNKKHKEKTSLAKGVVSTIGKQPSPFAQELARRYENGEMTANEVREQYLSNLPYAPKHDEED